MVAEVFQDATMRTRLPGISRRYVISAPYAAQPSRSCSSLFMDDVDEELEEVFLLKKSKGNTAAKSGSKKKKMKAKKTSMKGLLKMLRDVAEHAV